MTLEEFEDSLWKGKSKLYRGLYLMSRVMYYVEYDGGTRFRGGQSHAWKLLGWLAKRYSIDRSAEIDVICGYIRVH
jgi:hypothetical protein